MRMNVQVVAPPVPASLWQLQLVAWERAPTMRACMTAAVQLDSLLTPTR